jgi:hypothetical protein
MVQGTGSCSARACHGGPEAAGEPGSRFAYTYWLNHDKHADAYRVLFARSAREIVRRLAPGREPAVPAHQDARCLACHTIPSTVHEPGHWGTVALRPEDVALRADGVGCEACHGAAGDWLGPHTVSAWRDPASRKKNYGDTGMTWLNDPATRAAVCTGCHVGAPVDRPGNVPLREVNHDLIAAGHPRLTFELAADLVNMPRHWVEADLTKAAPGNRRPPAFEARVWLVGQLATARAALLLRQDRRRRGAWPEFAEHDCFACHHDLAVPSWRQQTDGYYKGRRPGALPRNSWNASFPLRRVLRGLGTPEEVRAFNDLVGDGTGEPSRQPDAADAAKAADLLEKWLDEVASDGPRTAGLPGTLLDSLRPEGGPAGAAGARSLGRLNWDDAVQLYLALAALNAACPRDRPGAAGDPEIEAWLAKLARRLALPRQPVRYDSPREYRRQDPSGADLRRLFDEVFRLLQRSPGRDK